MSTITKNLLLAASVLAAAPIYASATFEFDITINIAPLIGNPSAPFSLDLQLNDGAGTGDANNTATITSLSFGGGAPSGSATLLGGATGDLGSSVVLTDSSVFNEFYQPFTSGSLLAFHVSLTRNVDAGSTPDAFSIALLDSSLSNVPTTGVADTLLYVTADGALLTTGNSINPSGVTITAVPEPIGASAAAGVGLVAAFFVLRRRSSR